MKKIGCAVVAATFLLLASALPGHAWGGYGGHHGFGHHGFGHHGFGGYFGGGGYGDPYFAYSAPVVIQPEPRVYIQQDQFYWYYCGDAKAYYPYVQQCPSGWTRVVPPPALESNR